MSITRIDQFLAGISPYDAISNEAFLIKDILKTEFQIQSQIYAYYIHHSLKKNIYKYTNYNKYLHLNTPIIYHFSIGTEITNYIISQIPQVLIRYHNITPHHFFSPITENILFSECLLGRRQLKLLSRFYTQALAVSNYNKSDLMDNSFQNIKVIPLLRDYNKLKQYDINTSIAEKLKQKPYNILFVGRISLHKCIHDLIIYLAMLKEYFNSQIRLILIGAPTKSFILISLYNLCKNLKLTFSNILNNSDIIFLSNINDKDLSTYYKFSSLFLCFSEHEGFCAPLVEAMHLGLPVIAHNIPAVAETLSDGGILINKYDCEASLYTISNILKDTNYQKILIEKGKKRAQKFLLENSKIQFIEAIKQWLASF